MRPALAILKTRKQVVFMAYNNLADEKVTRWRQTKRQSHISGESASCSRSIIGQQAMGGYFWPYDKRGQRHIGAWGAIMKVHILK